MYSDDLADRLTPGADHGLAVMIESATSDSATMVMLETLAKLDDLEIVRLSGEPLRQRQPFAAVAPLNVPSSDDPFATIQATVDSFCARGPLIVWLDNAQDADAGSMTALSRLAVASHELPLSVVLSGTTIDRVDRESFPHRITLPAAPSGGPDTGLVGLPDDTHDLLVAMAVLGVAATPDVAAGLVGLPITGVGRVIRPAVDRGIVEWAGDGLRLVRRSHRDTLLTDLAPAVAKAVHRLSAELLQAHGEHPVVVAEHLLRAGDGGAVEMLKAAAAQAEATAPGVTADLLAESVELSGTDGGMVVADRVQALLMAGRGVDAEDLARMALPTTRNLQVAARLSSLALRSLVNRGNMPAALAEVELLLRRPGLPPPAASELRSLRCWILTLSGRLSEARAAVAVELAHADAPDGVAVTPRACLAWLDGRPREALRILDETPPVTPQSNATLAGRLSEVVWRAQFVRSAYGSVAAVAAAAAGRQASADRDAQWVLPFHDFVAAGIAYQDGRWDDAVAILDPALDLARETGTGWTALGAGTRALIDLHRGALSAAIARVDALDRRGVPVQFGQDIVTLVRLLLDEAEFYATAQSDPGLDAVAFRRQAARLARRCWDEAVAEGGRQWPLTIAPFLLRMADNSLRQTALDVLRDFDRDLPGVTAVIGLAGGMVAGDVDRIGRAAGEYSRLGWTLECGTAHEEAGLLAARTGDSPTGTRELRLAVDAFHELGATTDADRTRVRAYRLGVRPGGATTRRRPTSGWESLTPTEATVAEFLRGGLTNPEIGRRLFLSPRTIQTHVSHILQKTNLRSRVEVAAALTAL